jgi:hypothetical protein
MKSTEYHIYFFDGEYYGPLDVPTAEARSNDFLIAERAVRLILVARHEMGIYCGQIWAKRKGGKERLGVYYWTGEEVVEYHERPLSCDAALTLKRKKSRAVDGDRKNLN